MFFSNIMLLTACFMLVSCTFDHTIEQPEMVQVIPTNAGSYPIEHTYYFPWCERSPTHIPEYYIWRSNLIFQWCNALGVGFTYMISIGYRVNELPPLIYIVEKIKSTLQFIGLQINTRAWTMLNLDNILFMIESGIIVLNKINNAILFTHTISLANYCFHELSEAYFLQQNLDSTIKIIHNLNDSNSHNTTERFN